MGCVFCRSYLINKGIICETEHFFARFDEFPVVPGHAEVVSKRHVASLFDLTEQEWANLKPAISKAVGAIEAADLREVYRGFIDDPLDEKSVLFCRRMLRHVGIDKKPEAYNIGVNEGEAAGRTVSHLHVHLIPRFHGDVEDYVGGIRNIIPGMGNYRK